MASTRVLIYLTSISVSLSAVAKLQTLKNGTEFEFETETKAFTGCHWTVIPDPSIGKFHFSPHYLLPIIIVEVSNLIHAIHSGTEESALASPALVCTEEKWPWTKLVLVAPVGTQQFKNEKTLCHWTTIPDPSMG